MKQKIGLVLGIAVSLILISVGLTFSQEPAVLETGIAPEAQKGPDTQWLWGEVTSVDAQKNELVIKYLDYETDQEKEITIAIDDKTTYENVKAISEIKLKDTIGIDYTVAADGKNIAKNISVEIPQVTEIPQGAPAGEITPEDLKPAPETTE